MKDTINTLLLHRITIGWLLLFTANSLLTAIMAALAGTDWASSDAQTKFLIIVAILANWTGTLMAYFNTAASRAKRGESIVGAETTPPIK